MSVSAARETLPAVLESAGSEAITLLRHGRPVAVIVSPERYEELLEAEEDLLDVEEFDAALAEEQPTIPWAQVKADLGWL